MMNPKTLSSLLAVGAMTIGTLAFTGQPSLAQRSDKYFCGKASDGTPTTYARQATGKLIALIRWEKDWGDGYTPQKRCELVSDNFQKAYEKGSLKYLAVGRKNDYEVVCAMPRLDFPTGNCANQLFTLRKGENAGNIVKQLYTIGTVASSRPVRQTDNWSLYELGGIFLED